MKSIERKPVRSDSQPVKEQTTNKKRFQIVKLEPRIAPKLAANHNETFVRDNA